MFSVGDERKDTLNEMSAYCCSEKWMQRLSQIWNKMVVFEEKNPEFRGFDLVNATMEQLDVYLGFMFIHLNIEKKDKNKVMGSRYTPGTLKQMKTDLQNMLQYVFK